MKRTIFYILYILVILGCYLACEIIPSEEAPHSNVNDPDSEDYTGPELPVVELSGLPTTTTYATSFIVTVGGEGIVSYNYSLDEAAYSGETDVSEPIALAGLTVGSHTLSVIGKNTDGLWQWESRAATHTWTILLLTDTTPPAAISVSALPQYHAGNQTLTVSWTAPAESVLVVRNTGTINPNLPIDQTEYAVGQTISGCLVVYEGTDSSFSDTAFLSDGDYYYRAFAYDPSLNYADAGVEQATTVFVDAVYVRYDGEDTARGTSGNPLLTIQAGINRAVELGSIYEVRVAGSTTPETHFYGTAATPETPVAVMASGVSLYGGYNPTDWTASRDPDYYYTRMSYGDGTSSIDQCETVYADGLTSTTTIDGFTIESANTDYTANGWTEAVAIKDTSAVFTVSDCEITSGTTDASAVSSVGIYIDNSHALISGNRQIRGGAGAGYSDGIKIIGTSSDVIIRDNTNDTYDCIAGGNTSTTTSVGVYIYDNTATAGPSVTIENNHIRGVKDSGLSKNSYGVSLSDCTAVVRNNRIEGYGTDKGYGIYLMNCSVNDDGALIYNNHILAGALANDQTDCSYGIYCEASDFEIYNNNIGAGPCGEWGSADAVRLVNFEAFSTALANNNLYCNGTVGNRFGVSAEGIPDLIDFFMANHFFYWDPYPYYDSSTSNGVSQSALVANHVFNEDLIFDDDGYVTSPSDLDILLFDTFGIDGADPNYAWGFSTDKGGATRTGSSQTGWSIGCYEYDP